MSAGMLRSAVTLEQKAQTPSGASGMTVAYLQIERTWASVRGVKEQAFAEGVSTGTGATHVIRIRWRARVGFDHISGAQGRRWRVEGIRDPDDRRRWLDVFAVELEQDDAAYSLIQPGTVVRMTVARAQASGVQSTVPLV